MIDKIICGEWLTKNNEEVFVPSPSPYFNIIQDWREMDNVQQLRQRDTYSHVWENKSLLRKLITNTLIQGNYVVQGSLLANSDLLTSGINQGMPSAWDCGLDISTGPN